MRTRFLSLLVLGISVSLVEAQECKSSSQPKQMPVARLTLASGTPIVLRLDEKISSATASEGQTAKLGVAEDVVIGQYTVVSKGGTTMAKVTVAEHKRDLFHG